MSATDATHDQELRRRLVVAFLLVFGIVVVQAVGAILTGSLALLVDVVHSFTDSLGLLVALVTAIAMARPPSSKSTWGYRRLDVVSALGQALLLAGISVYALVQAVERWINPPEVDGQQLLAFGTIGLLLNLAAAFVLSGRRSANFNMRAAFLEVVMDALGTLAVIISAIILMTTGFNRADAIAAIIIALLMLPRAALLIRDTFRVLMEFTPEGFDVDEAKDHMMRLPGVEGVHDIHSSTISGGLHQLSAHVVVEEKYFYNGQAPALVEQIQTCVAEHFPVSVRHATIQLEPAATSCASGTALQCARAEQVLPQHS